MALKAKLKAMKDQVMFVAFSLVMYIADIISDVKQAYDYWM